MSFDSLGLIDPLLKAINKKGYTSPTPIQEKAIPFILERKDILASAQTGTGKTAGFALPLLQILSESPQLSGRPIRALILSPTRELAAQIQDDIRTYGAFLDIRSTVIFGGVNQNPQVRTLRNGVDILVATPGRLLDLYNQRLLSLSKVEILVLDEADRMLDMGFARDIKRILDIIPKKRQNLLFSATFSFEIKHLAQGILTDPEMVEAAPENTTADRIDQTMYRVDKGRKPQLLIKLISEGNWSQVLVFTRTKHGANKLSEKLNKADISSAAIHGNKTQNARTKALGDFKKGAVRVLVATDIAARGLDIPLLPHVVNFELPNVSEDYVHRIGRTGRAGASGEAVSLVSIDEVDYMKGIERLLGLRFKPGTIPGFEPTQTEPEAKPNARPNQPRRGKPGSRPSSQGGGEKKKFKPRSSDSRRRR